MKRMWSKNELNKLGIKLSQEQINTLAVRKVNAPSSTTLTDEEINMIANGCYINEEYLGLKNPVFFPAQKHSNGYYYGIVIAGSSNRPKLGGYVINSADNTISLAGESVQFINLASIFKFNGKDVPAYPSNTGTFTLKCIDGVLTWVEDI